MGVVYQAFDPDIERVVAIKMLHAHLMLTQQGDDRGLLARFRQEVQAAARCSHFNIVAVFDFGVVNDSPYMVMEYVDGIDLRTLLKKGTELTLKQAGDLIIQVLDALEFAHQRGVVHRDIKPANILLLDSGQAKVTDFGVAKLDTSELTNVGDVIGTPSYMSPEAFRGDVADGRSDLYSTAMMLLELITGQRPQKYGNEWTIIEISRLLASTDMVPPPLFKEFNALLMKALAASPALRFQTGREFAAELKKLVSPDQVYVPQLDDLAATVVQSRITRNPLAASGTVFDSQNSGSQIVLSADVSLLLSQTLAPFLGPMASRIIKAAASESMSLQEMIARLSHHIPTDEERKDFLRSLNQTGIHSMPASTSFSGTSKVSNIGSEDNARPGQSLSLPGESLQQLVHLLAHHVGPLASRMVKKALQTAATREDLFLSLSRSIPDEAERTEFVSKARKVI